MNKKQGGFTGIEILVVFAVVSAVFGGMGYILKDEIAERFKKTAEEPKAEESAPVANPFPAKPSEESVPDVPKEVSNIPDDGGAPILPKITAAGEWHGDFVVTAPIECKGERGGWEANLSEVSGRISGQFTTDVGVGGSVNGTRVGESASWSVGGGSSGVSFKGGMSGNTMSGSFTGLICEETISDQNPTGIRSTGTFFGGRIVK